VYARTGVQLVAKFGGVITALDERVRSVKLCLGLSADGGVRVGWVGNVSDQKALNGWSDKNRLIDGEKCSEKLTVPALTS